MNKKILTFTILICLVISFLIVPSSCGQSIKQDNQQPFRLFWFNTTLEMDVDTSKLNEPLLPGESVELDVKLKYTFTTPAFFPKFLLNTKIGNWIIFRDANHNMSVDLNLDASTDTDWLTAKLETDKITFDNFSDETVERSTLLNITVLEETDALNKGKVTISPQFNYESNWGLVAEDDKPKELEVIVGYYSAVTVEVENTTIKLPPSKESSIPIDISVDSNGQTDILYELVDEIPEDWNVSFVKDNLTLSPGQSTQLLLNITPPADFDNETITISFLPKLSEDTEKTGQEAKLTILIENDGSAEDEEDFELDTTILVIILIVIILSIIIALFLFRRKE